MENTMGHLNPSRIDKVNMRLVQVVLIIAIPLFALLAEVHRDQGTGRWTSLRWLMGGLAAWCIFEGFRFRRLWVFPSQRLLANDACNSKALRRWKAGQLIVLAMAEAVAWYGLVVRMVLHGTLRQASLFYAAGLFLLLLWTPRRGFLMRGQESPDSRG
jgi:hypothetical protein